MKIRIMGKVWEFSFCPHEEMGRKAGACDHPSKRNKSIDIWEDLRGEECLDTIIHECLHAGAYNILDEYFCERLGTDIARVILTKEALRRILDDPQVREVMRELSDETENAGSPTGAARPAVRREEDHEAAARGAT